jgi:hypothetical protein
MEKATTDRIIDTQIKNTHQQRIQLYRVVKAGQLLHQGKWLTRDQLQQKFPHLMEEINAMGNIDSLGVRNDPSGYWWPPTYSTWTPTIISFSFSISLIVAQFTIFGSFSSPELPEPF